MPARGHRRPTRVADGLPLDGLPLVAIVGRPNVGKSTLFNRIVGQRVAIVEDRARTTRDRLYAPAEWNGRRFVVIDTGGLEERPGDPIEEKVQEQARLAIGEADVILFVVDAAAGLTPSDEEAAEVLRRAKVPVIVVANKADNERRELEAAEAWGMGWEETYAVSAQHGRGTGDLLDALVWALPPESEAETERKRREAEVEELARLDAEGAAEPIVVGETDEDDAEADPEALDEEAIVEHGTIARIAIVGRPNVGKSSLLNALLGEERAIVSDIAGTTRDAIDTRLEWRGQPVTLVDTAGIRRRGRVANGPAAERFSAIRALRAIGRADVAILVLDSVDGLTSQDAYVRRLRGGRGVGLVVVLNKWDLRGEGRPHLDEHAARLRRQVRRSCSSSRRSCLVSAVGPARVARPRRGPRHARGRRRRVPTGALNRVLADATHRQPPPPVRNRRPRFYYATQASIEPPTFVLFASGAEHVHFSYRRYLENHSATAFGFEGRPSASGAGAVARGPRAASPPVRVGSRRQVGARVAGRARGRPLADPRRRRRSVGLSLTRAVVGTGAWGTPALLARHGPVSLVA
ncbi:MAG: ribosome biogenesis GTPase Der [Chloroflexota bacterium]